MKCGFRRKHFSRAGVLDLGYEQLKVHSKIRNSSFVPSSKIFVWGAWIWEGGTKEEMRMSNEALFKGVSTQFGPLKRDSF